ncbi:MAG: CrcB protein [Bacteroidia bacterium]|jgi:CrcB protein
MNWLLVLIGGGLGSLCRYGLSVRMLPLKDNFPWPTFWANIVGCFFIGLVWQMSQKVELDWLKPLIIVGFLGGFTTFSSFGLESIYLIKVKSYGTLAAYVVGSNMVGLLCVYLGIRSASLL